ncbi:MAG: Lauroyl/myristoyl acyltransferase [Acidimicrobiales bacterium]|nr:Lauroyl/myristoyl acyltransferase [Acidimicrobiales bacterium]
MPHPAYLAYRTGSAMARLLPEAAVLPAARLGGVAATQLLAGRRRMVARHQLRVRPELAPAELERAVRAAFTSYAHYWIESFRLPGTPAAVLDAGFTGTGFEHIRAAIDAGTGVVLAMPHLGAWEWAGFWTTAVQQIKVSTVVEAVEPPELAAWFTELRKDFGFEIIPLGKAAGPAANAALSDNRILTLLCDRDVTGGGIEVEFFGERTTLPAGPATIALRSGAALIASTCYFDGLHHQGVANPPIDTTRQGKFRQDVQRVTQLLAHELEGLIRLAPEQWHLLQPNWPSDRALAASDGGPTPSTPAAAATSVPAGER